MSKDFWHPAFREDEEIAVASEDVPEASGSIAEAVTRAAEEFAAQAQDEIEASDCPYEKYGRDIGKLVAAKQIQYGDSAGRTGRILEILYPDGVPPYAYDDQQLITRCLDKISRIAQRGEDGQDLGGESPWKDLAGYAILGWMKDEKAR